MFLINRIKYDANKNYDKIEKKIHYYSNKNLTNYIYYVLILNDKLFTNNDIIILKLYIKNLYISYYKFYIKNIINYGKEYIIKKEDIYDYIYNHNLNYFINKRYFEKYIIKYSKLNIGIIQWIENIFSYIETLPIFEYFNITKYRHYIFVSKMLDYIITKNMTSIIIYIAKGYLS
jgi:hypothetical protein